MSVPKTSKQARCWTLSAWLSIASLPVAACLPETDFDNAFDCDASSDPRCSAAAVGGDAGPDGEVRNPDPEPGPSDLDAEDAGVPEPTGCIRDDDCSDGRFCNGAERCLPRATAADARGCVAAADTPCAGRCDEAKAACDCSDPDGDRDGYNARGCESSTKRPDCNDADPAVHPDAVEVCDDRNVDEDCDPTSFGERDEDDDGYVSDVCANLDPQTGALVRAAKADCDDESSNVHPDQSENPCDGIDDNCDGVKEEAKWTFYADRDGDRFGDDTQPLGTECESPPEGYVLGDQFDCDDAIAERAPDEAEVCDGLDNDCNGSTDEGVVYASLPRIRRACVQGQTQVTCDPGWFECDQDTDELCETSSGTLSDCRACGQSCSFACGADACDEVSAVAVGGLHACVLTGSGAVACWGNGARGQLGNDSRNNGSRAAAVVGLPRAARIALGGRHSCAITAEAATLYCWGDNADQQLGVLGVSDSAIPRAVGGLLTDPPVRVSDVALGAAHSCAIYGQGTVACWGAGGSGRLGDDDPSTHAASPQQVIRAGEYIDDGRALAAGYAHTCLVTTDGVVDCWGDNTAGQLGIGNASGLSNSGVALRADEAFSGVAALVAGAFHTCALRDSQVYCWGSNAYGQLGRSLAVPGGSTPDFDGRPLPVIGLGDIVQLAAGDFFTCARDRAGAVRCWGNNTDGQRGDANATPGEQRTEVDLASVSFLAAGGATSCAVAGGAPQASCWGANGSGQLGIEVTATTPQPRPQALHSILGSTP